MAEHPWQVGGIHIPQVQQRVTASIGKVDLLHTQHRKRGKRKRPFNFPSRQYARFSKLTPDGTLSSKAAFEEEWNQIAEASPYSKQMQRKVKKKEVLDTEKLARKSTTNFVRTMLEEFPASDPCKKQVSRLSETRLGRSARKELLSTYEESVSHLMSWHPAQQNACEKTLDDETLVSQYSAAEAKRLRSLNESKKSDAKLNDQNVTTIHSIPSSVDGLSVIPTTRNGPISKSTISHQANELLISTGHVVTHMNNHQDPKVVKPTKSKMSPKLDADTKEDVKTNDTKAENNETNASKNLSTTLTGKETPGPNLIDAVVVSGNAPPMYAIERQAAPTRKPPAMAALAAFFKRNPACATGPAKLMLPNEGNQTAANPKHEKKTQKTPSYAGEHVPSSHVTSTTIQDTYRANHGKRTGMNPEPKLVMTNELVKQHVAFQVHGIPIENSKILVSNEMQNNINTVLANNIGQGMWSDRVTSMLAEPLSAMDYCVAGEKQQIIPTQNTALGLNEATHTVANVDNIEAMKNDLFKGIRVVETETGTKLSTDAKELNETVKKQYNGMQTQVERLMAEVVAFPFSPEVHEAATKIQRLWTRHSRFRYQCIQHIQKLVRGHLCRVSLERLRIEKVYSVIVIQAIVRGKLGRKLAEYYRHATIQSKVTKCQSFVRRSQARKKTEIFRQLWIHQQATMIQSAMRMWHAKKVVKKRSEMYKDQCAWRISQFIRMCGDRRKYLKIRQRANLNAIKIQRNIRVMTAKLFVLRMHWAASHIQALLPGMKARRLYSKLYPPYAGARGLQRLFRGMKCRKYLVSYRQRRKDEELLRLSKEHVVLDEAIHQAEMKVKLYLRTKEGKQELKEGTATAKVLLKQQGLKRKGFADPLERKKYDALLAFEMFDMDESGFIDRGELKAVMRQLLAPLSAKQLDAAMNEMDADNSGSICIDEFEEWYCDPNRKADNTSVSVKLIKFKLEALKRLRDLTGQTPVMHAKRKILNRECKKECDIAKTAFRKHSPPDYWYHLLYGEHRQLKRTKVAKSSDEDVAGKVAAEGNKNVLNDGVDSDSKDTTMSSSRKVDTNGHNAVPQNNAVPTQGKGNLHTSKVSPEPTEHSKVLIG